MESAAFFACLTRIVGLENATRYAARFQPLDAPFVGTLFNYEALAFYAYSIETNWHQKINAELRSGHPSVEIRAFVNVLDRAISKLEPYRKTYRLVYRGYKCPDPDAFLARYVAGARVTFPGFTSASFHQGSAFGGNVLFIIRTLAARAIWHLAARYEEFEILLPSRRTFRVLDVERRTDRALIRLEETSS